MDSEMQKKLTSELEKFQALQKGKSFHKKVTKIPYKRNDLKVICFCHEYIVLAILLISRKRVTYSTRCNMYTSERSVKSDTGECV